MNDYEQKLREILVDTFKQKGASIQKLLESAAIEELNVCRLLLTWSIGSVAGIVGHVLIVKQKVQHLDLEMMLYIRSFEGPLYLLGVSIFSGLIHHILTVKHQRKLARELEGEILSDREIFSKDQSISGIREIIDREASRQKGTRIRGFTNAFLWGQALFFLVAVIIATIVVCN